MEWKKREIDILLSNPDNREVAEILGRSCHSVRAKRNRLKGISVVDSDMTDLLNRKDKLSTNKRYREALKENARLRKEAYKD